MNAPNNTPPPSDLQDDPNVRGRGAEEFPFNARDEDEPDEVKYAEEEYAEEECAEEEAAAWLDSYLSAQPVDPIPEGFGVFNFPHVRFLLLPAKAPEKSGGIFVEQEAPPEATVVGVEREDLYGSAIGRRVVVRQYAGTRVKVNGEEYLVIDGQHILLFLGDDDVVEAR